MKKVGFGILAVLLIAYGIGQGLQLMGFIGTRTFSIPGASFMIIGLWLGTICLQKALKPDEPS